MSLLLEGNPRDLKDSGWRNEVHDRKKTSGLKKQGIEKTYIGKNNV